MRILFLGQKPIGEKCFDILMEHRNNDLQIIGAVSNEIKENVWWNSNHIYEICVKEDIKFIDNRRKNEQQIIKLIKEENIDFIISVGHNWILSHAVLEAVMYRAVNLHLAKLPDYKGNYTYNHAILNKEKTYGVTLHWMEERVDTGDYPQINEFPIMKKDTAFSLYHKSLLEGEKLFTEFVKQLCNNEKLPKASMVGEGCFYSKHSLEGLREIKTTVDYEEIKTKSRAFYFPPFEAAYFLIDGQKFYITPDT